MTPKVIGAPFSAKAGSVCRTRPQGPAGETATVDSSFSFSFSLLPPRLISTSSCIKKLPLAPLSALDVLALSQEECRRVRTQCKQARKLGRIRILELDGLLELKQRERELESGFTGAEMSGMENGGYRNGRAMMRCADQLVARMMMYRKEAGVKCLTGSGVAEGRGKMPKMSGLRYVVEVQ